MSSVIRKELKIRELWLKLRIFTIVYVLEEPLLVAPYLHQVPAIAVEPLELGRVDLDHNHDIIVCVAAHALPLGSLALVGLSG